jgi:hypothetical protein
MAFSSANKFFWRKSMKKLLSVLLTVAMLACMLPVFAVSAANPEVPVAKIDGKVMTGATASGNKTWNITADGLTNTDGGSIFVFDQEFKEGTIEWTMTTKGGDNGIVFGLEGESMDFWEAGDRYYFLFANNNTGEMILAKTGEGLGWCWMKAMPIPNFQKNATVDMKLVYDGDGHMEIYGNGALVYDYCDAKPLTGTRVGVRAGGAAPEVRGLHRGGHGTAHPRPRRTGHRAACYGAGHRAAHGKPPARPLPELGAAG